uniref:EF hand n=1 Tax=Steinernema glaseri TaxID=37863 RepID=A0A1I7ZKK3_9BILA
MSRRSFFCFLLATLFAPTLSAPFLSFRHVRQAPPGRQFAMGFVPQQQPQFMPQQFAGQTQQFPQGPQQGAFFPQNGQNFGQPFPQQGFAGQQFSQPFPQQFSGQGSPQAPFLAQQPFFPQQQPQFSPQFQQSPQAPPPQLPQAQAVPERREARRHKQPAKTAVDDFILDSLATTTTEAPPPPTPRIVPPPVDKNVDLDGDGALSLAEVQYAAFVHHGLSSSVVENLFNEVDKNRDGYLTSIEFNDIRPLVLAKAENAALRYMQSVDTDHNGLLSLREAQAYILKEYGIGHRDVERVWLLVVPGGDVEMDATNFSKLRRRIRGMTIRLARQIMKNADRNEDGHIDLKEAQMIAFEQEGIGAADVVEILASVDDNNDGELNAPEFADFERIVRARAVDTSRKALKVVDTDGSGTLTMDEAKRIAFDHYGFDERTLGPFFAQADENEDGELDAVEFAGFRSVIRSKAVRNAVEVLPEVDTDGDGVVSNLEAEAKARREDDMDPKETFNLFNVADQDKSGTLDKVELADFIRLVRLSAIKFATDHFKEFDSNKDKRVTVDELETLIEAKYHVDPAITRQYFDKVDVDSSGDLNPGEIVDFRHEIRKYVAERDAQAAMEAQQRREAEAEEERMRTEAEEQEKAAQIAMMRKAMMEEMKSRENKSKEATKSAEAEEPPKADEPEKKEEEVAQKVAEKPKVRAKKPKSTTQKPTPEETEEPSTTEEPTTEATTEGATETTTQEETTEETPEAAEDILGTTVSTSTTQKESKEFEEFDEKPSDEKANGTSAEVTEETPKEMAMEETEKKNGVLLESMTTFMFC